MNTYRAINRMCMETLNIIEDHYKYAQQNHDVPAMLEAIQQYVQVTAVFENNQN